MSRDAFKIPAGTIVRAVLVWQDEEGNEVSYQASIRGSTIRNYVDEAITVSFDGYLQFPNDRDEMVERAGTENREERYGDHQKAGGQ